MKKVLVAGLLAAAALMPMGAQAEPNACVAGWVGDSGSCAFVARGADGFVRAATTNRWQVTVVRASQTVTLATSDPEGPPIQEGAFSVVPGEIVRVTLFADLCAPDAGCFGDGWVAAGNL